MKKLLTLTLLISLAPSAFADKVKISEEVLLKIASTEPTPQLDQIKASLLEAQSKKGEANDALGTNVYAGYNYIETNELPLIQFAPVFSPVTQYQVGVKKNFKYGIQGNIYSSFDQRSGGNGQFNDLTTVRYGLELNLDLWKDLFGRLTRKKLENAETMAKQAKLQADVNEKVFKLSLRRIYWSLVANNEKMKISKNLYQTALKQAKDARKRKASSIADKSEVARYESQVSSRKGSLLYLEYERENILKQLRSMIPSLSGKDVELSEVGLNKTIFEVLECTTMIDKFGSAPYQYTQYDDLAKFLKDVQKNQEVIDESYDGVDLKLSTSFINTGVASINDGSSTFNNQGAFNGSYDDAIDDMNNNDRSGYSYGLQLNIPLGAKGSDTADVKKEYNKRKLRANIVNMENNILATHTQISKSIKVLGEVIKSQKSNSKHLSIRLKEMKRKYNQARIPEYVLIQDQDALMSSDLSIVDTQLAILNTLLDYFVVFTETPCSFNRK